jgi:uncharacterized protein YbcI
MPASGVAELAGMSVASLYSDVGTRSDQRMILRVLRVRF